MSFKPLGLPTDLQINIPQKRSTNWADQLESDAWLKIVQHDHTGESGRGRQITTAAIANNAITTEKLQTNSISTDKVQNLAITTAKLADLSVTTPKINDLAITGPKLADNAVDDTKIKLRNNQYLKGRNAANNADVDIIKVNSSNEVELSGTINAVPSDNSVSTVKLQDGAVNSDKLASNAVTTAKILDSNITTAKIATGAVTNAKMGAVSTSLSSLTIISTTSTTMVESADTSRIAIGGGNLRPILITLVANLGSISPSFVSLTSTGTGTSLGGELVISKNINPATNADYLGVHTFINTIPSTSSSRNIVLPVSSFQWIDVSPTPGSNVYYLHFRCTTSNTVLALECRVRAIQL